jgi:hypothetical protein
LRFRVPAAGVSLSSMAVLCRGWGDVDPGKRSRVNESHQPARLGRGLDHETDQAHSGADHPQALTEGFCEAVDGGAVDRPGQDRRRRLPRHRGGAAHLPPLAVVATCKSSVTPRRTLDLDSSQAIQRVIIRRARLNGVFISSPEWSMTSLLRARQRADGDRGGS